MKPDTSSYYPKSPLSDLAPQGNREPASGTGFPASEASPPEEGNEPREPWSKPEAERAADTWAAIMGWVFVPLLMPVYGVILAFTLSLLSFTPASTRLALTGVVFAFNVLAPALLIIVLKHLGLIHDVGLNERKERFIPYMVCVLELAGTALFMHFKGAPQWLVMFFFGGAATGIAELVINRWWKISVHAAGVAGIVALLTRMLSFEYVSPATFTWLLIAIGCAGLLGASRIWAGRHTLSQVLAGYAVGFCTVYFLM